MTATPLGPAGPFKVMVPVEFDPPATIVGFKFSEIRDGGVIVS